MSNLCFALIFSERKREVIISENLTNNQP